MRRSRLIMKAERVNNESVFVCNLSIIELGSNIMKKSIILAALLVCSSMMTSCNQMTNALLKFSMEKLFDHEYENSKTRGPVVDNPIEIGSFNEIKVSGNVMVVYTQGDSCTLTFHGNELDLQEYDVKVKEGCLRIQLKDGRTSVNQETPRLTAIISSPTLEKVEVMGACCMEIPDTLHQDSSFEFEVSGMASLQANCIEVKKFDLDVSGASNLIIKRLKAQDEASLEMSGACNIQAAVQSPDVEINMSGAGSADINVESEKVEADLSGTSSLVVSGKCGRLIVETSGMSDLNANKLKVTEK